MYWPIRHVAKLASPGTTAYCKQNIAEHFLSKRFGIIYHERKPAIIGMLIIIRVVKSKESKRKNKQAKRNSFHRRLYMEIIKAKTR